MTPILFRCDASLSMGSGHVMRCRTLARELQRRGAVVTFLSRRQPGDLIGLLEQDFAVLPLPALPLAASEGLEDRELYAAWLGCTQEQDAGECLEALTKASIANPHWLVVDHYGLDACWEAQMLAGLASAAPPKMLVIDDLSDRPHQADLLLDQNFCGDPTAHRYQGLVPPQCRQLLGPHYALLGSEYPRMYPLVPSRTELRRILLFFGGVDSANLTGRALEALMDPALVDLEVNVVLSPHSPHRQAVAQQVACRPHTTLSATLPSLAGLIARADLAIGAGGATTWERACLGLPSLVVAIAANQLPFAQALNQAGHLQLLGDGPGVTAGQIRSAVLVRLAETSHPDGGRTLTDGWGSSRVALAMLGPQGKISLRPAVASDEALLLRWANDPQVRANSFSQEPIAASDHHKWFQKGLMDPNRLQFVAIAADDCPIGQIRFDRQLETAEGQAREATIGFSIDRCARGYGLATELVRLGLQAMGQHWGHATEAVAEVLTTNPASNASFDRCGFKLQGVTSAPLAGQVMNRWRWPAAPCTLQIPPSCGT